MSHQEKRAIIVLINLILVFGLYSLYIFNRFEEQIKSNPNDFMFWGKVFLAMIPVIIVYMIIMYIIYSIIVKITTNEDIPTLTDEMDKLIELRSVRVSQWVFSLGFVLAMASQAIGMQPWVLIITLLGTCFVSGCASEITKIYLYRKGF